jgi:hypothetical protein
VRCIQILVNLVTVSLRDAFMLPDVSTNVAGVLTAQSRPEFRGLSSRPADLDSAPQEELLVEFQSVASRSTDIGSISAAGALNCVIDDIGTRQHLLKACLQCVQPRRSDKYI